MRKPGALYTIVILLAMAVANSAAQAVHTGPQASPTVRPNLQGCVDCAPASIPTLPEWCAIVMGLVLIGLSLFFMRRSKASTTA